jgi:hypothetical protein
MSGRWPGKDTDEMAEKNVRVRDRLTAVAAVARQRLVDEYVGLLRKEALSEKELTRLSELGTALGRDTVAIQADIDLAGEEAQCRERIVGEAALREESEAALQHKLAIERAHEEAERQFRKDSLAADAAFNLIGRREQLLDQARARLGEIEAAWQDLARIAQEPKPEPERRRTCGLAYI